MLQAAIASVVGVAILIHKQLQFIQEAGCISLLLKEIQGQRVIPADVYALNIDDPVFSGQLENKIRDREDYALLLYVTLNQVSLLYDQKGTAHEDVSIMFEV